MKIKFLTKQLITALAVAGGLTLAASAQAQDYFYCVNITTPLSTPSAVYPVWSYNAAFTQNFGLNGLEIYSTNLASNPTPGAGFGSFYEQPNSGGITFDPNGNTQLGSNDTLCIFQFTVNPTPTMAASGPLFYTNYNWIGLVFYLNMQSGIYHLTDNNLGGHYSGSENPGNPANIVWQGSNVTATFDMAAAHDTAGNTNFVAYCEGGSNYCYGFNFGIDPASIFNDPIPGSAATNGAVNVTINSIAFGSAPTPPPNLTAQMVGTNIVVSWPDANTNTFNLQESQDPAFGTGGWGTWGFPPVWSNGTNTVVINPPFQPFHWFRLVNTNEFGPYVGFNNINP